MRLKDIRELGDLREVDSKEALELVDELGQVLSKRGWELLRQGKTEVRRALGAPGSGTVALALVGGFAIGLGLGAALGMLGTPMSGADARRRLREQADRIRESVPAMPGSGNGRASYERYSEIDEATEARSS